MRVYPIRFQDRRGIEKGSIQSDGSSLYLTLRGIKFEGGCFEGLSGDVDQSKFDYERFADGSGDLTNFNIEVQISILLFDRLLNTTFTETLFCSIQVGNTIDISNQEDFLSCIQLTTSFGHFSVSKKLDWFENALVLLQKQLPENIYLKICMSCKFSNYHPVGSGMFGSMCCFKNYKEEVNKIEDKDGLMELWSAESIQDKSLFFVQETFDCPEHQFPSKNDWLYKDWTKTID